MMENKQNLTQRAASFFGKKSFRPFCAILGGILLLGIGFLLGSEVFGSGSSSYVSSDMSTYSVRESDEAAFTDISDQSIKSAENSDTAESVSGQKLIYTYDLSLETMEYDALLTEIQEKTKELGGYVESSSTTGGTSYSGQSSRYANLTLRIPNGKTEELINSFGDRANVLYSSCSTEDVTLTYSDTTSRVKALEEEQSRLLELMDQAASVSDLIEIEAQLTEVRSELEEVQSRLSLLDNQITYDTVYLSVTEVRAITPTAEKGFFEKVKDGFLRNLYGIGTFLTESAIWILTVLPFIILLLLLIFLIRLLIGFVKKKINKKKADRTLQENQKQ